MRLRLLMKANVTLAIALAAAYGGFVAAVAPAQTYPSPPLGHGLDGINVPVPTRQNATRPRTVQLLGEAISRYEGGQRVRIIRDIGECGLGDGLKYLEMASKDPDPAVRAEVARAAAKIGDKAFLPTARTLLADPSPAVQREAILLGAALGDPTFADSALISDDPLLLSAAMEAASTPQQSGTIAGRLPGLPLPLQLRAMAALARMGATEHAAAIAAFADDAVPLAAAAMRALGTLRAADQVQTIIATLDAAHPTVRRDAVAALASTAAPQVQQQQAIRMLQDSDPTVREAAARLLVAVPLAEGVGPLVEQLDDGYAPLHHAAREALVAAKGDAIPAAAQLLDHADPRRREDGSYILGRLKSDVALERHIALMEDPDWDLVAQVSESLGEIGRREAVPAITKLVSRAPTIHQETIGKEPEKIRLNRAAVGAVTNAVIAAGKLRITDVLPVVKPLIPERELQPYRLRSAIIWAFGVMGDPNDTATLNRFIPIYGDLFESGEVKIEALKALGNIGYKPAAASLKSISEGDFSPNLRWMAFWSHRVITGEPTEYDNPEVNWTADVAIIDLSGS